MAVPCVKYRVVAVIVNPAAELPEVERAQTTVEDTPVAVRLR
jgi:hypothetical protein